MSDSNLAQFDDLLRRQVASDLTEFLANLPPGEAKRLATRLEANAQGQLFTLLPLGDAAQLLHEMAIVQAAEVLLHLQVERAAELLGTFPSNEQADLIAELKSAAAPILAALPRDVAQSVLKLSQYHADTAGGLMIAEFLAFAESTLVEDVIEDLRLNAVMYSRFHAQYTYVVDAEQRLTGVLRLRDLLLVERTIPLREIMTRSPLRVPADMPLDDLLRLFDRHPYFGLPVVDSVDRLLGVVLATDVEEALSESLDRRMLLASGVWSGEEYRSMNWTNRVMRRFPWLAVSLLLSLVAASVIGWYEETLTAAIALAVFLPVISGMGGNSGNQALAVSIRELSLGLVQPREFLWVVRKEAIVGIVNGVILGIAIASVCLIWQRNLLLSVVVGVAIIVNTLVAACLGGILPLALKRWKLDPALASGPILAAITDLCGFLVALLLADNLLPRGGQ
ncbi:magnesium transporter [Anatilimnocola aggregata]|nr:magnesium transporter [Anatilimnocola aggregata]